MTYCKINFANCFRRGQDCENASQVEFLHHIQFSDRLVQTLNPLLFLKGLSEKYTAVNSNLNKQLFVIYSGFKAKPMRRWGLVEGRLFIAGEPNHELHFSESFHNQKLVLASTAGSNLEELC